MLFNLKKIIDTALAHQGFRRYFANTSWMFAEQMLRMLAGLLVGVWVARYLGPEKFGIFSYAIAFVAIFSSIAKLGLDGIVVRDLVNAPENRDVYLGTAFWLKLTGGLITVFIIAITTLFTTNDSVTSIYILIIASGLVFQSFEVVDFYFQSKVLSKFVSICKLSQLLISSILKIYFVITEADLLMFVVVSLVDQLTLAIILYFAYRLQRHGSFYHHFDFGIAKKLLNNSWPLIFSGILVMIYMRIDQIMIEKMMGAKFVGIYTAAVRLSEVWYFIPMLITNSVFPAVIGAKKINRDIYYIRLQHLFTLMVWIAIAIAIPITLLSDWLVLFLYGKEYVGAGQVLIIQIWAGVFVSLGVASSCWLTSENLQIVAFYRTFAGAIINIVMNLILIPIFGITGAAFATLISYMFAGFLFDFFNKKTKTIFLMKIAAFGLKRK